MFLHVTTLLLLLLMLLLILTKKMTVKMFEQNRLTENVRAKSLNGTGQKAGYQKSEGIRPKQECKLPSAH